MKKILAIFAALAAMAFAGCAVAPAGDAAATGDAAANTISPTVWIVYIIALGALMYFMFIRPSRKQKKEQAALYSSMAVGDSVLTTSGFYGVIIDMTDDTVIVEFGSNKNCRIPMQKAAIVQVEKPDYTVTSDNK